MKKIFIFQILVIAIASSNAANLYCNSVTGSPPQCEINYLTNVTSANEVISVVGQPSNFVDSVTDSINLLDATQMDYFPTGIFNVFPNINNLNLYNNSIKQFGTDAVINCSKLRYLTMMYQKITHLPAKVAQSCSALQYLYVSFGEVSSIDADVLFGLTALEVADFSNNKISCIPPKLFSYTPNLTYISLMMNEITVLDPQTFINLPRINFIDLYSNKLTNLPNFDLNTTGTNSTMNGMFTFSCQGNPITAIDPSFMTSLFLPRDSLPNSYPGLNIGSGYNNMPNNMTCVPTNVQITKNDWVQNNSTLTTCYNNWTPAMANPVIPCAPTTTTSTTTTTTAPPTTTAAPATNAPAPPSGAAPCCQHGVLQVILQAFRNMTFSAGFASA